MSKNMFIYLTFLFIAVFAAIPVAQSQTLSITPDNQDTYDNWEPTNDGTLTFTVAVGGLSAANISAGEVRFDFETVSNWDGTCMNDGSGTDSDLNFTYTDQTTYTAPRWTQWSGATQNVVAAWNSSDSLGNFSMNITVRCKDYGAFGILRVKLYNTSSSSDVFVNEISIAIPKDDNGNYIADKSDTYYGYTNPALDGETGPDTGTGVEENNNPGDGLVQFEEYRGFKVNGGHKRLSPTRKDIFIRSPTVLGIGNASNLPFEVHEILDSETEDEHTDRSVNYNGLGTPTQFGAGDSWNVQDTKALWVFKKGRYAPGSTRLGDTSVLGSPSDVDEVNVYTDAIDDYAPTLIGTTDISATTDAAAIALQRARTTGHEIGHALALSHPFHTFLPTGYSWDTQGAGWYGFGNTSEKVTNTVYDLIRTEAIARFKGQTPTTNFLDTSGSSWTIRLNSYVANRSLSEALGSYTYESGTSVMDYNLKLSTARVNSKFIKQYPTETFTQAIGPGIFRSSTYHQLHNWEYQLLGDGVTPQTNPQWTARTVSTNTSSGGDTDDQDTTPTELGGSSSSGSVTLSWSAPADTDETVTNYAYRYRESSSTTWSDWTSTGDANTSATISSLTNGLIYMFQVRTYTMSGWGDESDSFSIRVPTTPNAPTNLSGSRRNGGVRLTWSTPSDDGGSTITDYDYRYSFSSGTFSSWTSAGDTSNGETITGLTNGRQYQFQVRARNSIGAGSESATAYATPATVPGVPQNFTTTAGDGEVTLTWQVPSTNGGSTITDYEYSYREGSSGNFGSWTSAGTDQWERVTGLTNDTSYEFRVRARNRIGPGTSTGPIEATPEAPAVPPESPTDLSATYGDGQITLSWTAPSSSGSSAITRYEYRYATGHYPNHSAFIDWASTGSTDTTYVVTGLTNGTQYLLQVRAVNSERASSASNTAFQTPLAPAVPPESPTDLSATYGDGQITLSWTAPSSSGSSAITRYEYRYATGHYPNHSAFTDWASTGSTDTTYVVTGLTNGTQYLLQVRAVNSERASSASNTAFQTPLAPASAPIWSDIPGPYNLTVGDSFSLDLNSYVTGSPTITKTLGTIPAGLSLSGGVVSGTVTTVEDRSIQFAATNSAGYALSEWVNIVVQAAQ